MWGPHLVTGADRPTLDQSRIRPRDQRPRRRDLAKSRPARLRKPEPVVRHRRCELAERSERATGRRHPDQDARGQRQLQRRQHLQAVRPECGDRLDQSEPAVHHPAAEAALQCDRDDLDGGDCSDRDDLYGRRGSRGV